MSGFGMVRLVICVVTIVIVPLLLSYSVSVKGVFSPAPPYSGYSKPSHSFVIMLLYLVCLINIVFKSNTVYNNKYYIFSLSCKFGYPQIARKLILITEHIWG